MVPKETAQSENLQKFTGEKSDWRIRHGDGRSRRRGQSIDSITCFANDKHQQHNAGQRSQTAHKRNNRAQNRDGIIQEKLLIQSRQVELTPREVLVVVFRKTLKRLEYPVKIKEWNEHKPDCLAGCHTCMALLNRRPQAVDTHHVAHDAEDER